MLIADLDDAEQLAFGGLLRMMIRKDGDFSEAEETRVDALGEANGGRDVIWGVISRSAQALRDDAAIRAAAGRVERPEARALMLDMLTQVAAADGTSAGEDAMLEWLRSIW
jgi:hypothetical protein